MTKTTHFGTKTALNSKTPAWARWMFKITFAITTAATFIIAADTAIPAETALRIGVWLKGVDLFVGIVAESFGVTYSKQEP